MAEGEDQDEVGYRRPPKQYQWKPGQSGNPRGRPKGVPNFRTDVKEVLRSSVTVTEGGRQKRVSVQRAMLLRLGEKALKGDNRSIEKLLDLALYLTEEEAGQQAERALSAAEESILERALESRMLSPVKAEGDGRPDEGDHGK